MKLSVFITIAACVWFTITGCSRSNPISGGGTGAGNARVAGIAVYPDGSPAADASIRVCHTDWLADTTTAVLSKALSSPIELSTDAKGAFIVNSLEPGIYRIEANDDCSTATAFPCTITVATKESNLGKQTLKPYSTLTGIVNDITKFMDNVVYIRIYGLMRAVKADSSTGRFAFTDLPAGIFDVNIGTSSGSYDEVQIKNVEAKPADSIHIGSVEVFTFESENYSTWNHHRTLRLNTTATGVETDVPVVNFPLLLRLDDSVLTFSETCSNGMDLRFAGSDGKHYPYEISRWDSTAGLAEVWVCIDTIHPAADTQKIIMYWGNPAVSGWSESEKVFSGFSGVYHLDSLSPLYNAADTAEHADAEDVLSQSGVIGNAAVFNGTGTIHLPTESFTAVTSAITVSFWETGDDTVSQKNVIFRGYGESGKAVIGADIPCNGESIIWFAGLDADTSDITGKTAENDSIYKSRWNHWAFTKGTQTGMMNIYLNGTLWHTDTAKTKPLISMSRFTIGSDSAQRRYFYGTIDEFRIENIERSKAWVKLCYETQRPDQRFISFDDN